MPPLYHLQSGIAFRRWFRDDLNGWEFDCPVCGCWFDLDADQMHGLKPIPCPSCGHVGTYDLAGSLPAEEQD